LSKLRWDIELNGAQGVIRPVGVFDEGSDYKEALKRILDASGLKQLIFDLGHIARINSCGVRDWLLLLAGIPTGVEYQFQNVNEHMVEQANAIPEVLGRGPLQVTSFQAPYVCMKCKKDYPQTIRPGQVSLTGGKPVPPAFACPTCNTTMRFDWIEEEYFYFLLRDKNGG
jgi:hypothetical protein